LEQIIYLDADDNITTVRERLGRVQANRIVLVVPAQCRIFQNLVNLKLLQRYACQNGLDITLISRDGTVRTLARTLQIPVRSSLANGQAESSPALQQAERAGGLSAAGPVASRNWARRRIPATPSAASVGQRIFGYLLALLLIAFLGGGVLLLVPEATVDLSPATEELAQTITVKATTDARASDLSKNVAPARLLQATVEDSAQADSTGRKQEPAQKATGRVVVTNRSGSAVTIPQGTVLRTGTGTPIRFLTSAAATVEPNAFTQVPIVAELAGSDGNVPAWAINQVDGALAFQVSVINDIPTSGGTEKQAQLVTAADRQRLRDDLFARLKSASLNALRRDLKPGDILFEDNISIRVEDEAFDRQVGDVSKSVGLRMRLTASTMSVPADGLNKLAQNALESRLTSGATLMDATVKLDAPTDVQIDGNTVIFRITARATSVVGLDVQQVRGDLQGQPIDTAQQRLTQRYRLAGEPRVTLQNGWLGRLPLMGFRIHVNVAR